MRSSSGTDSRNADFAEIYHLLFLSVCGPLERLNEHLNERSDHSDREYELRRSQPDRTASRDEILTTPSGSNLLFPAGYCTFSCDLFIQGDIADLVFVRLNTYSPTRAEDDECAQQIQGRVDQ